MKNTCFRGLARRRCPWTYVEGCAVSQKQEHEMYHIPASPWVVLPAARQGELAARRYPPGHLLLPSRRVPFRRRRSPAGVDACEKTGVIRRILGRLGAALQDTKERSDVWSDPLYAMSEEMSRESCCKKMERKGFRGQQRQQKDGLTRVHTEKF
jgi:hypothetical protein